MFNFFNMLGAGAGLPEWVTTAVPIIKGILVGYIALAAIAIIVLILCQPSNSQGGLTGITGQTTDTYYAHNKGATKEGRMKKATTWIAVSVLIATILFFVLTLIVS